MRLRFDFNFKTTKAALLYLGEKGLPGYDKYKACKLLFLADREHLLRFGRTITGDDYYALYWGPVPTETLDLLVDHEELLVDGINKADPRVLELARSLGLGEPPYPRYQNREAPDMDALSESEVIVLDQVARDHGQKDFAELKRLTHSIAAYSRVWREDPERRRFLMRLEDFFAETPEREGFLKEILENQYLKQTFGR